MMVVNGLVRFHATSYPYILGQNQRDLCLILVHTTYCPFVSLLIQ